MTSSRTSGSTRRPCSGWRRRPCASGWRRTRSGRSTSRQIPPEEFSNPAAQFLFDRSGDDGFEVDAKCGVVERAGNGQRQLELTPVVPAPTAHERCGWRSRSARGTARPLPQDRASDRSRSCRQPRLEPRASITRSSVVAWPGPSASADGRTTLPANASVADNARIAYRARPLRRAGALD